MKIRKNVLLEKVILFFLLLLCLMLIIFDYYPKLLVCILIILVEIFMLIKVRKNNMLLFIYLCIFYFDYSVIVGKYIGIPIKRLSIVYSQIPMKSNVHFIGLMSILLFHIILALLMPKVKETPNNPFVNNFLEKKASIAFITLLTTIIILGYLFFPSIVGSRALYEYAIILFCLGFYSSKKNSSYYYILVFLMAISTVVNMYHGGRIISLMPMIAYFIIHNITKLTSKKLIEFFVIIIVVFTFFGLYGDLIEKKESIKRVSFNDLGTTLVERKFTLDTSVAAYWAGLTYIATSGKVTAHYRMINFMEYITKYTLLGSKSNYIPLNELSYKYYVHYSGGYAQSYFYFWLGYVGVIIYAIYISIFINIVNNITKESTDLKKIICIYFISTLPRWYLYYPTPLFRGIVIMLIIYLFLVKLFKNNKIYKGD